MNFEQAVVLVTGGARRLGAATARRLHAEGARVILHYQNSQPQAQQLCAELNAERPESAALLQGALSSLADGQHIAAQALSVFGRLDGLVNNASTYFPEALPDVAEESSARLLGSNFLAPLGLAQALAPRMHDGGAIVNLLDARLGRGHGRFMVYSAAKAALEQATANLAVALAPRLRVNAVAPGHVLWSEQNSLTEKQRQQEIERIPLQRLGAPEDIAAAVRFLLSDEAAYINGVVLPVDGGLQRV